MSKIDLNKTKEKVVLALSGGVDSVVLLDLLAKKKQDLVIFHLNHNLRGEDSFVDQKFCSCLAKKYNYPFYTETLKKAPKNEEEARIFRYEFLEKFRKKTKSKRIVLAHHKDDLIETLFLQLSRGVFLLNPLKEFGDNYKWRPLINYFKTDLIFYAKQNKLKWVEDKTNFKDVYTRNIWRNQIIPVIKDNFSSFADNFSSFADNNFLLKKFLEEELNKKIVQILNEEKDFYLIKREDFLNLDDILKQSLIKRLLPNLYKKHILEILALIKKGVGKKEKHQVFLENKIIKIKKP
jgi:tRNA(Ile)-lysidine synthetase-like protein